MLLMYLMYFVVATLLFQLLVKHGLAALRYKRFNNKHLLTQTIHPFVIATTQHTHIVSFAIVKLFLLFNNGAI